MFPVIDKKKTGRRIRELMDVRNITVRDVQTGLSLESTQSVYYWLNGRSLPTIDNLYALSQMLQVPVDDMLCGNRSGNIRRAGRRPAAGPGPAGILVSPGRVARPVSGRGRMTLTWYGFMPGKAGAWGLAIWSAARHEAGIRHLNQLRFYKAAVS